MNPDKIVDISGLARILRELDFSNRSTTAIAGPPGSGKSTCAEKLAQMLNAETPDCAMVMPMDGYHYDDLVLRPRGWLSRKGAPHTFDVAGFKTMLERLTANDEPEIAVPVFDRELEIARNSARIIPSSITHVIVEGNYLLLDSRPWTGLARYFDTTVYLDVPIGILRARLEKRWEDLPPGSRIQKLEENDIPNAKLVMENRRRSDYVVRNF